MKKLATIIIAAALCICTAIPATANNYTFESGADSMNNFGNATSTDLPIIPDPLTENTRRNKDVAVFPPSYGVFSGDIPTDTTSLYHDNSRQSGFSEGEAWFANGSYSDAGSADVFITDGALPSSSSASTSVIQTEPWYYSDGTIGSLYIHRNKKTLKVYEGESLENMQKGIGHFEMTSAWDGNCGLAGHNRGTAAYFSFVKDMQIGDKITYTTKYGERTYEVYSKTRIPETDYSGLRWTAENIVTLITCVEGEPSLRWLVQAREVK